ncbi:ubiquitin-like protein (HubA) [Teratosphaeria destructans]|uniref:Ubiquitin-like modifier HUB1 n=1 Tax=Teratosphaeria destructans TaxID=418781 RepID=A0A9W7SSQ1_9PEZI|nr:ubiquitin-like protein (HubA) [Teratosphaeria destructans]
MAMPVFEVNILFRKEQIAESGPLDTRVMQSVHARVVMADRRSRSASPARDGPKAKKQKTGGFKWKEKQSKAEDGERDSGRLERGYRDRSPRRDSRRDREEKAESDRRRDEEDETKRREEKRAKKQADKDKRTESEQAEDTPAAAATDESMAPPPTTERERDDIASKFGSWKPKPAPQRDDMAEKFGSQAPKSDGTKKEKKKKAAAAPVSNQPMIVVNVNDRLGTKAAIPCFASDSVKGFKALVAMQIGRQPHEIMIKRQGERPFKDQLTLEDYGVSNGVQLDLELDTGD